MHNPSNLPESFRKQVADKLSDIQKDVKMWNGLRVNFAAKLQEWDPTPPASENDSKERLFPSRVDTSAEIAMETREQVRAELERLFDHLQLLIDHTESAFEEIKQEIGESLVVCHD